VTGLIIDGDARADGDARRPAKHGALVSGLGSGSPEDVHAQEDRTKAGNPGGVISLFSGALGLDLGLERAGFVVRVAVEADSHAANTIRVNRPHIPLVAERIEKTSPDSIRRRAGLGRKRPTLVAAGPSCQSFSTAGRRRSLDDDRGNLFRYFVDVVRELRPRFFVMENVPGVLSAAVRHRPLAERGPGFDPLDPEEQHGSAIRLILSELRALNYYVVFGAMNAADYGAAQHRNRLIFLGSRDGEDVRIPAKTHAQNPQEGQAKWRTLREALAGLDEPSPLCSALSPATIKLMTHIAPGRNWRDLPAHLQREALGKAADSWGGRSGFYRRLAWDAPTPALTTNPVSRATMLVHPDEQRPLSVGEYARVQGFPDDWVFDGGIRDQYLQIGNAVALPVSEAIGEQLIRLTESPQRRSAARKGVVACADRELITRFNARPRTILNPQRMRGVPGLAEARVWMASLGGSTREPLDVTILNDAA
jgi:DNA (cytosine-5)-methyltransferase 1